MNNKITGIEVKSSGGILKRGADVFRRKFTPAKIILTGKEGMPVEYFLKINPEELF